MINILLFFKAIYNYIYFAFFNNKLKIKINKYPKNKKYYFFGNYKKLNKVLKKNKHLKDNYNNAITKYRGRKFNYLNLKNEDNIYISNGNYQTTIKTFYYFTFNNSEIISTARVQIDKYDNNYIGLINMIHVNELYINKQICKKTVKDFIELINKKFKKINKYKLYVLTDNLYAISCYQSYNFVISKELTVNNKQLYEMIYLERCVF
jgi:hypothetical protein